MNPVLLCVYTGAGLVEVGDEAADDMIPDLGHDLVKFVCESDNRALDGAGRQGADKYLFDAIGADCAYGVKGHNQAPKLFAVLDRLLDVFRERAAQGFPGKRTGDSDRFMRGNMDIYGGVRYIPRLGDTGHTTAFFV